MSPAISTAIVGASGYTGAELLRLAAHHPALRIDYVTGDTQAGVPVASLYPHLGVAYPTTVFEAVDIERAAGHDLVFLGLPHEASMAIAPQLVGRAGCVVDLSAAFRLKDAAAYPQWYGFTHDQPDLLAQAAYGLPELHRGEIVGARLVATPGCYVTAASLALRPLVAAGLIDPEGVIVDAASGVTGKGRALKHDALFCTIDEDFVAYGLLNHRHTPEIEQVTGAQVLFTPHLVPMNRGILATCYARPTGATSTDALLDALAAAYAGEPFVRVSTEPPSTKATLGSNAAHLTARYDARTGRVLALCAIDNLCKGASGGAVQAANVALGLDETLGLSAVGVAP